MEINFARGLRFKYPRARADLVPDVLPQDGGQQDVRLVNQGKVLLALQGRPERLPADTEIILLPSPPGDSGGGR